MSEKSDGVNREGLDYRAGWLEALRAFGTQLQIARARARKGEIAGLEAASRVAQQMHQTMVEKMKSGG
jgi:hypothetical protein